MKWLRRTTQSSSAPERGAELSRLHLAQAGKKILILERGPFMPQEKLNWDTSAVFLDNRYHTKEVWQDKDGKDLHPQQSYFVGGQTKVFGAAMFRMRAEDFGVIQHQGGMSPAWPISYAEMEPFYTRAEETLSRSRRPRFGSLRTGRLWKLF